ncbi:aminotransferase class I/II [Spirosoma montaniterrae]|uniref:Aminotransferase class I/II n=1 Tax=Spirosoma montaniterrae TaxID=1178516 RepID=A0A1P9X4J4_9BACT|nr:aminotransferase class I/II-fold pyridoxal phosphate-dependent enzyme [Spirosoma montaniterrae]AQG82527.1 aminotransferase class I/II [Spirosoma montaniterrae]
MNERTSKPIFIDHIPDREITYEGRNYLFFSGTAYLGLPQSPAFRALLTDSMARYGTAFGSSRNGNLQLNVYDEAEAKLARWVGAEAALTLSSGMMAGQVIVNYLRGQRATFIYGPYAHPALWHDPDVQPPTLPFADWAHRLPVQIRSLPPGPVAILTNSVNGVRSDYYSFDWLPELPDDRPITLVVDDSHGLGVLNDGRGIWPQLVHKQNVSLLVTASLAKGMGLPGGAVFSSAGTINSLRQTAFFGACSPMPPAYADAFLHADALYAEGRDRLYENIRLAEKLLMPTGLFHHAPGYPVFFTEQDDLYSFLLERGILVYSFAYPTVNDRANTRIVISAFHTVDDIQTLANAVYEYVF